MTEIQGQPLAGISFDWVVVRDLRVTDNPQETRTEPLQGLGAEINIDTRLNADGRSCRVSVKLTLSPPTGREHAFQGMSATVEGQFSVQGGSQTVPIEEFSKKQAPAILMPFVREAIASATAKTRFGAVLLPPINVVALAEAAQRAPQVYQG